MNDDVIEQGAGSRDTHRATEKKSNYNMITVQQGSGRQQGQGPRHTGQQGTKDAHTGQQIHQGCICIR